MQQTIIQIMFTWGSGCYRKIVVPAEPYQAGDPRGGLTLPERGFLPNEEAHEPFVWAWDTTIPNLYS